MWSIRPKLWKTQSGHSEVAEACPELARDFPEPPVRGFGIVGKIAAAEEVLKALCLDAARGIEDSSIRGMLDEPSRELWDHDGTCVCGKQTYLFSRCPSCIEQEALDTAVEISERAEPEAAADLDQESQEVSLEVGALVAATFVAGGAGVELLGPPGMGHGLPVLSQEGPCCHSLRQSLRKSLGVGTDPDPQPQHVAAEVADAHWTSWVVHQDGAVTPGHQGAPCWASKDAQFYWSTEANWHGHRQVVNLLWRSASLTVSLDPSFARLINLHGKVIRVEGWWDSNGEQALGHRKSLRAETVLAAFSAVGNDASHWSPVVVTTKITADESVPTRTLAFVGQEPKGRRAVLEMFSPHFILTAWDHRTEVVKVKIDRKLISLPLQADPSVLERERLAVLARDAANVYEFRVTGSLRTSCYEAQRRDPSLAGSLRRTEPPTRVAGDGLLERDVTLRTGQTVCVPVVPNGIAGANGVTWRHACYNAAHDGVLGAHRSAEVTIKLLERAVWWPDLEADVKLWVSKCLACLKGRARPTKVEARAVKCSAETCWQEVSVDCEGPNREDRDGYRYSLTSSTA